LPLPPRTLTRRPLLLLLLLLLLLRGLTLGFDHGLDLSTGRRRGRFGGRSSRRRRRRRRTRSRSRRRRRRKRRRLALELLLLFLLLLLLRRNRRGRRMDDGRRGVQRSRRKGVVFGCGTHVNGGGGEGREGEGRGGRRRGLDSLLDHYFNGRLGGRGGGRKVERRRTGV